MNQFSSNLHTVYGKKRKLLLLTITVFFLFSSLTSNGQNPTVTINQSAVQPDPTNTVPINFTVLFDQPVIGFTTGDVVITSTAGGTPVSVVTGGPMLFNVTVSGMISCGTVIVNIPAGVCTNTLTQPNLASTSLDNTVTYSPSLPNPNVTINQAATQSDPTSASPINFTVMFDQPVTGFVTGDVTLSGTAGATTAIVTGSGSTYNVAVSGMTASGTVIATIAAGVAQSACTQPNNASTSTDNTVTISCVPPVVNVTPTVACGGVAGIYGVQLTASAQPVGPIYTFIWSPLAGLYTNPSTTAPYTGTNLATVYAAPTASTIYTVTATNTATGCFHTATALVNYTPPAPVIVPSSVNMCLGDPPVKLRVASGTGFNLFCSGTVNIPIPDNNPAGAASSVAVTGIPPTCTITGMSVSINMPHTKAGNMVFVLKAPNGQVLNLDYHLTATGGTGATTGFVNTVISSIGTVALSTGVSPYTGTFRADALAAPAGGFGQAGPTGMLPTATNWLSLFSGSVNGNWTLGFYDGITGDVGTLTSWCLRIDYSCTGGIPAGPAVWSPAAGLFWDAAATIPYVAGTPRDSVWVSPVPAGVYTYQVITPGIPGPPVAFSNPAAISIPLGGAAALYPSNVTVSGLPATGARIRSVVLNGVNHTRSSDIDVLLQSPSGQNVILMSDVGGSNAINATYTFADWSAFMSTTAANPTGTYTPANSGSPDNFPAPGPGSINVSSGLNTFTGNYNGTWKLFVVDDDGTSDQGLISGGYTINFDTVQACYSPARSVVVTVGQPITITQQPANQTVCVSASASFTVVTVGTGPFTYQWQLSSNGGTSYNNIVDGGVFSGALTNTLLVNAPPVAMNGNLFRIIINGGSGCSGATSAAALLTVNPLPAIAITANPLIIGPTQTTTILSTVTPNPAATYTWYYNNAVLPGAVSSSLVISYGNPGDYQLKVTDVNGCTNLSNIITIANSFALNLVAQPNPNSGRFQVTYYSGTNNAVQRTMNIFNNKGDKVMTKAFLQTTSYQKIDVDVRANGKGIYWVELVDGYGRRIAMNKVVVH